MNKFRIERNRAIEHPKSQTWILWLIDETGNEWTWAFASTYILIRKVALRYRKAERRKAKRAQVASNPRGH